jgi:hypothetical protein
MHHLRHTLRRHRVSAMRAEGDGSGAGNPVLMRVHFSPETSVESAQQVVADFPFASLREHPLVESLPDGAGLRLLFRRVDDDGGLVPDGGLLFSVQAGADEESGPALDVSRIPDGCEDMPKVIREKQVRLTLTVHTCD